MRRPASFSRAAEAVAGEARNPFTVEQALGKFERAEPGSADVEQYEHAAFRRNDPAMRRISEDAADQLGPGPIIGAQHLDLGKFGGESRQRAGLDKGRAALSHAQEQVG